MKRITALVLFLMTGSLTQAAQMLPLVQTFPSASNTVLQEIFHVEDPKVRILVSDVNSSSVSISLPDGTTISEANASEHGFSWSYGEDLQTGRKALNVISDSAPNGEYSFVLTSGASGASLSVTERPGLQFFSFEGVSGSTVQPDKYFALAMTLAQESGPALDATVTADILDTSGSILSSFDLNDDGATTDRNADDGMYTSVASIPDAGSYQVRYTVQWNGHQGLVYKPIMVNSTTFTMNGDFSVHEVDSDNNGLNEAVEVNFGESSARDAGEYHLNVVLVDSEGGRISKTSVLETPSDPLTAIFDVKALQTLGALPWKIEMAGLMKDWRVLGVINNLGTLDIDPSKFEKPPMVIQGISGDRGIDSDGDGIFDHFEVDVEIETQVAGYYGFSTDLSSADGDKIAATGRSSFYLSKGVNTLTLNFAGSEIGRAGFDGPYLVTNFLLYPNFNSQLKLAKLVDRVGESAFYTCSQFLGCGSNEEAEIRRIADALCSVHGKNLKAKLNKIQAIDKKNPDVAEKQLTALYGRAITLEKSGACPPPHGWVGDRPLN